MKSVRRLFILLVLWAPFWGLVFAQDTFFKSKTVRTMKDPEFAAELKKAKLDLNPLDGATLENNIKELFALDNALIPKLTEILK